VTLLDPDRLAYRPSEAARLLGVGRSTFYRWIGEGHVNVVRPGGEHSTVLVPRAELERLLSAEPA
jgi:excisionase family DNA binding protein